MSFKGWFSFRAFAYAAASVSLLTSALVLIGWHLGLPAWTPLAYCSALGFFLASVALLSFLSDLRWNVLPIAGTWLIVAGAATLASTLFAWEWTFCEPQTTPAALGVMIILLGASLWCMPVREARAWRSVAVACLALALFFLGAIGLLAHVSGIDFSSGVSRQLRIPRVAAIDAIALSIALGAAVLRLYRGLLRRWIPLFVGISVFGLSNVLSIGFLGEMQEKLQKMERLEASGIQDSLIEALHLKAEQLRRMALRWNELDVSLWSREERDAERHLEDYPSYLGFAWVDPSWQKQWAAFAPGEGDLFPYFVHAIQRSAEKRDVWVSPLVSLPSGHTGLVFAETLEADGSPKGYLAAMVDLTVLTQELAVQEEGRGFAVALLSGDKMVYASPKSALPAEPVVSFSYAGVEWQIAVRASSEFLSDEMNYPLFLSTYAIGLCLSAAFALLLLEKQRVESHLLVNEQLRLSVMETKKRLDIALESAGAGTWSWEADKGEVVCDAYAAHLFGYPEEERTRSYAEWLRTVHPADREKAERALRKAVHDRTFYECEYRVVLPDGSTRALLARAQGVYSAQGEPVRLAGVVIDTTERKKVQDALEESEEKFRSIVEHIKEWIWNADKEGVLTYNSPGIRHLIGVEPEAALGKKRSDYVIPEDREMLAEEVQQAKQENRGWSGLVFRCKHQDGRVVWVESHASPIVDVRGEISGYRGADRDISARKSLEEIKEEFITQFNHALRTPLTAVRGALALMVSKEGGGLPEALRQLWAIAVNNTEKLIRAINGIFDVRKLSLGDWQMALEPLDLAALSREALRKAKEASSKNALEFSLETDAPSALVMAGKGELLKVLEHLLSNAIKASPQKGRVAVSIAQTGNTVRLSIQDEGPGVPREVEDRIFRLFSQEAGAKGSGLGLGLYTCKGIVDRLGGTIGFSSEPGKGALFYIELPRWYDTLNKMATVPRHYLDRVLVCVADRKLAALLDFTLREGGVHVDLVHAIEDGRARLKEQEYAALVLDLAAFPEEGMALLHQLGEFRNIPVVLVGADVESKQLKLLGTPASIVECLERPVDPSRLREVLQRLKERSLERWSYILCVEDDLELLSVLAEMLEGEAQVIMARSLKEAKEKLAEHAYGLVLLDIILPDGPGTDLLPLLPSQVPVVAFSINELQNAYGSRVAQTLVKTEISNEEFLGVVRKLLRPKG